MLCQGGGGKGGCNKWALFTGMYAVNGWYEKEQLYAVLEGILGNL
jgi:hypothetical protein